MKHILPIAFRSLILLACAASAAGPATAQIAPGGAHSRGQQFVLPNPGDYNVLTIVLDDLGTDMLSMYGEDSGPPFVCSDVQVNDIPTPRLNQLRAEGIMFTNCYVDPICTPTRACIQTGRYAFRTGMGQAFDANPCSTLSNDELFIPEILKLATASTGVTYKAGAFGKWHLACPSERTHPVVNGYDLYEGNMLNPDDHYHWPRVHADASGGTEAPEGSSDAPSDAHWDAAVTARDAAAWINGLPSGNHFFAYVAFSPPHAPVQVPPDSKLSSDTLATLSFYQLNAGAVPTRPAIMRYVHHTMVEAIDTTIGDFLDSIDGVMSNTMVIVIGDNGTPGGLMAQPLEFGRGKRTPFDLGTRVPMLVKGPIAQPHAGAVCRAFVEGVDLWRTILNIAGVRDDMINSHMPVATTVDSLSILGLIQSPASPGRRTFAFSEQFAGGAPGCNDNERTLRTEGYRCVRHYVGNTCPGGGCGSLASCYYKESFFLDNALNACEQDALPVSSVPADLLNFLRTHLDALSP